MSNLSELLPAGSSVKSADFVAQGTLASGVTVGLRSDGKVEAIAQTAGSTGTETEFRNGAVGRMGCCYDTGQDKVLIFYTDTANSGYMTMVVGTMTSSNSISFGTPVIALSEGSNYCIAVFDPSSGKSLVGGRGTSSSNTGAFFAATISGTTPSVGAKTSLFSGLQYTCGVYDTTAQKILVAGAEGGNSNYAAAAVATISGTSVSFGSKLVWNSTDCRYLNIAYNPVSNNSICAFYRQSNYYGQFGVLLVSGTSVSIDSIYTFATTSTRYPAIAYDVNTARMLIVYQNSASSSHLWYRAMSFSGNTPTQGTAAVLLAATGGYSSNSLNVIYHPTFKKIIVNYGGVGSVAGAYAEVTISGTTATLGTPVVFNSSPNQGYYYSALAYNPDQDNMLVTYYSDDKGEATAFSFTSTNVSSYVGITDQAISSAATGKVVCKGGVSTGATAQTSPPFVGAQSTITTNGYYITSAYDSTTKNTVFSYYDASNSGYGTARVASISGTTITYGTPVVYDSAGNATWGVVAYDSNTNRIVIAYRGAPSYYPYAVVGTVSGTSISFGTPVAIENIMGTSMAISFDSSANKVVIAYRDNNGVGKVVVGTPSGTSISFGSIVQFASSVNNATLGLAYDSTNNKTVLVYADTSAIGKPTALVGTISGTSISFGSAVVISSDNVAHMSLTFDPSSGKVVVSYNTSSRSYVGTVSGTSISFGSVVTYNGGTSADVNYLTVDTVTNNVVLFFEDSATNGAYVYGTISGTSIAWSTPADVNSVRISYGGISFNVDSKLTIMGYRQDSPLGGFVSPLSLSTISEPFTIGSNYFVQDDGTISTTSSTTKAGTALSTTSLLITG